MSYWVGVDDNINKGWPKVINATSSPAQYLRVYGPYSTQAEAVTVAQDLPNTTHGWRAVCGYSQSGTTGTTIELDYAPNTQQYAEFYGPYATQALAQVKAATMSCPYVTTPAIDICNPEPKYSIPPTLECSLVCSALAWPQQSGSVFVSFYRRTCLPGDPDPSIHFPATYTIPLGCPVGSENSPVTGWVGRSSVYNAILLSSPYVRGYTVRFAATMGVLTSTTLSVTVTMERLFAGVDIDENNPPDNQWGTCGSFSGVLTRVVPPGVDPADRTITRTYTADLIDFIPSCTSDVHYGSLTVTLIPMKFGCDGTASGGVVGRCSLISNTSSYSCLTAYVRPLLDDGTQAQTTQLGLNDTGSLNNGCFEGTIDAVGYTISPAYAEESASYLLAAGCPGEAVGLNQQIQKGSVGNFQIMVKSINKGPLYLGIRRGDGYSWTFSPLDTTTQLSSVPLCHKVTFNGVVNNAGTTTNVEVYIYGLRFPPVEIQDCMGTLISPTGVSEVAEPEPVMAMTRPSIPQSYTRQCIHLGPIIKKSCCGAPSLHTCNLGLGDTRPVGGPWNEDEITCRGCPSYKGELDDNLG